MLAGFCVVRGLGLGVYSAKKASGFNITSRMNLE
jgi:hypothetical protein